MKTSTWYWMQQNSLSRMQIATLIQNLLELSSSTTLYLRPVLLQRRLKNWSKNWAFLIFHKWMSLVIPQSDPTWLSYEKWLVLSSSDVAPATSDRVFRVMMKDFLGMLSIKRQSIFLLRSLQWTYQWNMSGLALEVFGLTFKTQWLRINIVIVDLAPGVVGSQQVEESLAGVLIFRRWMRVTFKLEIS